MLCEKIIDKFFLINVYLQETKEMWNKKNLLDKNFGIFRVSTIVNMTKDDFKEYIFSILI